MRCSFSFGRLGGFRVRGILGASSPLPTRRITALEKRGTETSATKWVRESYSVLCVGGYCEVPLSVNGDWVFACLAVRDLSAIPDAAALSFVEDSLNSHLKVPYRRFSWNPS